MRLLLAGGAMLALSACGPSGSPPPRSAGHIPVPSKPGIPPPPIVAALSGQNAQKLISQFGQPMLDVTEGTGRKLQFGGPICVLDTYLYPKGRGEAVVTYLETRQRSGAPIDPASCIAALGKRKR